MRAAGRCSQFPCSDPPVVRYTWPGNNEAEACFAHQLLVARIANAMGLHVQFIPLRADSDNEVKP